MAMYLSESTVVMCMRAERLPARSGQASSRQGGASVRRKSGFQHIPLFAPAHAEPTLLSTMSRNPASRMSAVVRLQSGGWDRTRLLIRRLKSADYLYLHRQCRGFWLRSGNKKMTVQLTVSNAFISNQVVDNPRIIPHPWLFPPQPASPVSRDIHHSVAKKPAVCRVLASGRELHVPNPLLFLFTAPKISVHFRHCSRFLEKPAGDPVRSHCVAGTAVLNR